MTPLVSVGVAALLLLAGAPWYLWLLYAVAAPCAALFELVALGAMVKLERAVRAVGADAEKARVLLAGIYVQVRGSVPPAGPPGRIDK